MRSMNDDGKDEKIAEMINDGKNAVEIKKALQVSSRRITRVREAEALPALAPGPVERTLRETKTDALKKDLADLHALVEWHEKREYELLDLVANLSDDNIKLRAQVADLTPSDA